MQRLARWAAPITCIAALTLLAYSNSFHASFNFDDFTSIRDNPLVRSLDNYVSNWSGYRKEPNRYVGNLTFALNYRFGQLDTTGYHAFNFCIHLLNALLVFALVLSTFGTPRLRQSSLAPSARGVAFVAAALFAAHPIQTQAVTYIVQRLASLATTFYLLAVVLYARWRLGRESGRWSQATSAAAYASVLIAAVLAMKTKEIAFTLPAAIVLYEVAFFGRPGKRTVWSLLPILATSLVIPLTILGSHGAGQTLLEDVQQVTAVRSPLSRADYLRTEIAVVVTYLRLLVLPIGQNLDYDYPAYHSFLAPKVALSVGLLLSLVAAAIHLWRRRTLDPAARLVSFGIVWFFLALLVESSVIPIVDVIFEHRVYLPSVGFFVAVATGAALIWHRWSPMARTRNTVATGAVLAAVLAFATFERNKVWADEMTLWTDVAQKSPGKGRPRMNLALALSRCNEPDRAIAEYRAAIQADPELAEAHNNLGVLYFKKGMVDRAIVHFLRAIDITPNYPEAHNNLGIAYGRKGLRELAAAEISAGMKLQAVFGTH
jgi:hypothetical protein